MYSRSIYYNVMCSCESSLPPTPFEADRHNARKSTLPHTVRGEPVARICHSEHAQKELKNVGIKYKRSRYVFENKRKLLQNELKTNCRSRAKDLSPCHWFPSSPSPGGRKGRRGVAVTGFLHRIPVRPDRDQPEGPAAAEKCWH